MLKSTEKDTVAWRWVGAGGLPKFSLPQKTEVFVNFVDHGGVGLVAFPNGPVLHVKDPGITKGLVFLCNRRQ